MRQAEDELVRVVVADDSDIAAACLERMLEEDTHIHVVGRARDGAELLKLRADQFAQVLLLDALMPEVAGLTALRQLASQLPVIVISSEPVDSAVAREALAQGAVAFFSKAELSGEPGRSRLRDTVLRAGRGDRQSLPGSLVLVAGSTGAVAPLTSLLRDLRDTAAAVRVVQHLPEGREGALTHTLQLSGIRARAANHGDPLHPGVLVARYGHHMRLNRQGRVQLVNAPPVHGHRPSAEVLLESAIPLAQRVVAVMLSGLGADGAHAMAALAEHGAKCWAQSPDDCRAPSMPLAALAASHRVQAARVEDLGKQIRRTLGNGR